MRNIIIKLSLIFSLIVFYGCTPDMLSGKNYNYTIENKSGKTVTFIPYSDDKPLLDKKVILENNNFLNKKYRGDFNSGIALVDVIFNDVKGLSGLLIIFDDKKKIIYKQCTLEYNKCNENLRNIFNDKNNSNLTEVYTFTEEDYNLAEDCNGNCEE